MNPNMPPTNMEVERRTVTTWSNSGTPVGVRPARASDRTHWWGFENKVSYGSYPEIKELLEDFVLANEYIIILEVFIQN